MAVTDLLYRLRADSSQLSQELKKGERDFATFAEKTRDKLNTAGLALGVIASGIAGLTANEIGEIDQLQKFADTAGLAAEDMGGLELAAKRGGKEVDRFVDGIGDLSQKMRQGAGIFDDYGIKVRDASGALRPTIDVVKDVADVIQGLGPGAEATALAIETMGGSGRDLIPVLLQGSEGLEQMRDEADRLGLTFDENTGRAAERFNDALGDMDLAFKGIFRRVAGETLPVLGNYATQLNTTSRETSALSDVSKSLAGGLRITLSIVEGVAASFSILGKTIGGVLATIVVVAESSLDQFNKQLGATGRVIEALGSRDLAGAKEAMTDFFDNIGESGADLAKRTAAVWEGVGGEIERVAIDLSHNLDAIWDDSVPDELPAPDPPTIPRPLGADKVKEDIGDLTGFIDEEFTRVYKEAEEAQRRFLEGLQRDGARVFEQTRTPLESFNIELQKLVLLLDNGAISTDTYLRAVGQLSEKLNEADVAAAAAAQEAAQKAIQERADLAAKELEESLQRDAERIQEVAQTIGDGIADALFGPAEESLDDFLKKWFEAVARIGINAAAGAIGGAVAPGFASGGYVSGPGTGTSDSILARLSSGEFVMRSAAVQKYGAPFFAALNSMQVPGRMEGGPIGGGSPPEVTIANVFSDEELARFMASRRGQQIIMNSIQRADSLSSRGGS